MSRIRRVSTVLLAAAALSPALPASAAPAVPQLGGGPGWMAIGTLSESQPGTRIHAAGPDGRDHVVGTSRLDRALVADFSNDGHRILVTSAEHQVVGGQDFEVYDLLRGTITRGHAPSEQLRFLDPAGTQLLAVRNRQPLARVDLAGRVQAQYEGTRTLNLVEAVLPTMDGRRVLATDDSGRIRLFDAASGRVLRTFGLPRYRASCLPRWNTSATAFDAACSPAQASPNGPRSAVYSFQLSSSTGVDRTSRVRLVAGGPTEYVGTFAVGSTTYLTGNDGCFGTWVGHVVPGRGPVAERWWKPGSWARTTPVASALWVREPVSPDPAKCNGWGYRMVRRDLVTGRAVVAITEQKGVQRFESFQVADPRG